MHTFADVDRFVLRSEILDIYSNFKSPVSSLPPLPAVTITSAGDSFHVLSVRFEGEAT